MNNQPLERVELSLHTTMSDIRSTITPKEAIRAAMELGHKAIAVTDRYSVQSFYDMAFYQDVLETEDSRLKVLYGAQVPYREEMATVLAKDQEGLKALYRLVSGKEITEDQRQHLMIGNHSIAMWKGWFDYNPEVIKQKAEGYDYVMMGADNAEQPEQQECNRWIYRTCKALGIPVVAVSDCTCIQLEDHIYETLVNQVEGKAFCQKHSHLQTTEEMLREFAYLGEEAAYEVVVENTNKIADSIAPINFSLHTFFVAFKDESAIRRLCEERLETLYGDHIPGEILTRLEEELLLLGISAKMLLTIRHLTKHFRDQGVLVGARGGLGSFLVCYLLGISDVNPLPAHYRCNGCRYAEFAGADDGYDLPQKTCPVCGKPMAGDGHNIPYEGCLVLQERKYPEFSICLPESRVEEAKQLLAELYGKDRVAYAGWVSPFQKELAESYVRVYAHLQGRELSEQEIKDLARKLIPVKSKDDYQSIGILLLPEGTEWEDVTPIRKLSAPANGIDQVSHMNFWDICSHIPKISILPYGVLERLGNMLAQTGVKESDIDYQDPRVYRVFEQLLTLGIPDFSADFCKGLLDRLDRISFSNLTRVCSMAHSTGAWNGNAEHLLDQHSFRELIAFRDDVFLKMQEYGIDQYSAYRIMTLVRKGKFDTERKTVKDLVAMIRQAGVPEWYIDSMKKIHYLFPKAHALHYTKLAYIAAWFSVYHRDVFIKVTLQHMGAEKYAACTKEELQDHLHHLTKPDRKTQQEKEVIALLLEALRDGYEQEIP